MVKIPTSTRVVQLSDTPVTTLQQGSAMGQGVAAMGQMVQQIAQKEQVRQDNDQFLAARTKYDEFNLAFETESAQLQGDATKGLVKKYQEDEETTWNEIYSGLSPRAARAFEQYRGGVVGKKSQFHAFAEHKGRIASAQNTFNNAMAVIAKEAVDAPYDVAALRAKLVQTFDHAVSSGAVQAADREAFLKVNVAGLLEKAWSSLYELAPEEALKRSQEYGVSDSMKAVYVEKHKDKQSTAQSITLANELSGNGKSLKENLDSVHEKYADQPELHDKLVTRLKMRFAEEQTSVAAAKAEQKKALVAQVQAVEVDPENRGAASEKLVSIIDSAPPELKRELTAQANEILNPSGLTDYEKMAKLEKGILNKEITSLEDLRTNYAGISRKDQLTLEDRFSKFQKGEVPKLTIDKENRVLAELGYIKKMNNPKKMKEFNAVRAAYRVFFAQRNPQSLKEEMATNLAFKRQMERDGIVPDAGMFGSDKGMTFAEAVAENKADQWFPDVLDEHKPALKTLMTALNYKFSAPASQKPRFKGEKATREVYRAFAPVFSTVPPADLEIILGEFLKKGISVTPANVLRVYRTKG
ncbi:hypothetical protein [Halodesulfovibrio sp.]|jgi:predicted GNAT family acetyltransferase|uniref:hypothetical protein n=1 Tax=Halodesulfovibrio sp. TaxID=1912772 RepID=UPI0025FF2A84|nr:hypothetical protein [Halodesulfovibrio sp.]MCT4626969.1 hypothetical protein [Halodesulfovibrio sp.]